MFTPVDWTVHLEESRISLSCSGQKRYALLAALKHRRDKGQQKQAADKPAPQAVTTPAPCCQSAEG